MKKYLLILFFIFTVSLILSSCGSVTYDAGEAGVFDSLPSELSLEGHTFGGWFYDEEFIREYRDTDKVREDITVWGKWIPNEYTVTFSVTEDVTSSMEELLSQKVIYKGTATVPYLTKENQSKLAVVGWYLDEGLTEKWDPKTPITSDITVYPMWGDYYDSVYFNAPKIYIETENKKDITSKTKYIKCEVTITNTDESPLENASAQIRGRGNSTWGAISDKKPYRVKFDKKTNLFGMGKEKDYLLIANYIDYTLMRNDLVFDMATKMGLPYTTETEWVHLFLNGKYEGVYLLCEHTETGANRVDIGDEDEPGNEEKSGEQIGFLIEFDGSADVGEDRFFKLKPVKTARGICQWKSEQTINIKSPGGEYITQKQYRYIKDYVTKANELAAHRDYDEFCELVDINSLIDCFIVTQASYAVDMGWAFYLYKPAGEKLYMGPLWDYDQSFGNSTHGGVAYDNWYPGEENLWFSWLLDSRYFRRDVKARWEEVYEEIILKIEDRIDYLYDTYQYDINANFTRWNKAIGYPYWRSPEAIAKLKTYDANVNYLKRWLDRRIDWMNDTISSW